MTETAAASPDISLPEARDDRMPRSIPFIVSNEFAERFCYYGINAILTIYMTQHLHESDASATTWHSLFKSAAYFFPLLGAVVADVFWGKFRTIMVFSLVYATGCGVVAMSTSMTGLLAGLLLVAFGTGGIKPCVSTNVGDQFTSKNQHLIERAFSYFYLAINAGSSISIYFCPRWLDGHGPRVAFGIPAAMMLMAVLIFWLGRRRYAVVPPAGKRWLDDAFSKEGLKTIGSLAIVYFFVAFFWALWDQSNGQTWTLQARSALMDKDVGLLGYHFVVLPAQIQVVNGLLILLMVPVFTFAIYPLAGKLFKVTPLRKIGFGLFTTASSFLVVARIEARIQAGHSVSAWWQILAYVILSASEVLVSITALEFSYKQAPLRMKSFIMALFLLSTSLGNLMTAGVNRATVLPLHPTAVETGAETWVHLSDDVGAFVTGQKIDLDGKTGIVVTSEGGKPEPLAGTYLIAAIDKPGQRVRLMDPVDRKPLASTGAFTSKDATVSTYRLVGPEYFRFFALIMACVGVLFIFVAYFYKERTHLRDEGAKAPA